MSSSNHELYFEALRWTNIFVKVARGYGILVLAGAIEVLVSPSVMLFGLQQESSGVGKRRSGALSLATAGVMGVLVASMASISLSLAH